MSPLAYAVRRFENRAKDRLPDGNGTRQNDCGFDWTSSCGVVCSRTAFQQSIESAGKTFTSVKPTSVGEICGLLRQIATTTRENRPAAVWTIPRRRGLKTAVTRNAAPHAVSSKYGIRAAREPKSLMCSVLL